MQTLVRVLMYTLVCPVKTNEKGERISGCGQGWESTSRTQPCSGCGLPGVVRDTTLVIPLQAS